MMEAEVRQVVWVGTDRGKMHAAREAGTLLCGKFIGKVMEKL